jgi:hypothetical protein
MEKEYCYISRYWWNCLNVYQKERMCWDFLYMGIKIELVD